MQVLIRLIEWILTTLHIVASTKGLISTEKDQQKVVSMLTKTMQHIVQESDQKLYFISKEQLRFLISQVGQNIQKNNQLQNILKSINIQKKNQENKDDNKRKEDLFQERISQKIDQIQRTIISLAQKRQGSHQQRSNLENIVLQKQKQIKELQADISQIKMKNIQLSSQKRGLQQQIKKINTQNQHQKAQLRRTIDQTYQNTQKSIAEMEQDIKERDQNIVALNRQKSAVHDQNQALKYLNISLSQEKLAMNAENQRINILNISLSQEIKNISAKISTIEDKLKASQSQNKQLDLKMKNLVETNQNLNKEYSALKQTYMQKQQDLQNKSKQSISQFQTQIKQLNKRLQTQTQHKKDAEQYKLTVQNSLKSTRRQYFLNHQILADNFAQKQYICEQLQRFNKSTIVKTKLLYTYDFTNKTKFHLYIQGKPHLVLLIKLNQLTNIAAYIDMPYLKSKQYSGNQAMLFALKERETFSIKEGCRAFSYDDFYIIIGNAELRVRVGQCRIYTNFGIVNGFFENRGKNIQFLLGPNVDKETDVLGYEFHQVFFEKQKVFNYQNPPNLQEFMQDK